MSGITGWLDFKSQKFEHEKIVEEMTNVLAHRGPDAQNIWIDKYIGIGYRHLAVLDLENNYQPMRARNSMGCDAVISFCGEIYNSKELRSELVSHGYFFDTDSDAETLLKGYFHWKENIAQHLNGMYSIAIWDLLDAKLFLIRDHLGIKPLYYYTTSTGVIFASEIKALLKHPLVKPRVTTQGLCELFDMVKTPELTVYDDIYEVRPGNMLICDINGIRKKSYWKLEAESHNDNTQTTIEHIKNILSDTIQRQIVSDVPICTLLSGGLDSSAITALAAKEFNQGKLSSFSVDFEHNVGTFVADGVRGAADAPFARELANHVGTQHSEILLCSNQLLDTDIRKKVLNAVDAPPAYWGDMWSSLYLLFTELSTHSKVALSGEAADEVFGGYQWFRNPAALTANTFPWLTSGSSRYFGGIQLFSPDFVASLDRDTYRANRYDEALQEVPILEGESVSDKRMREISYLAMTRFLQTLLDRNDRLSMAAGLEVRVPFCDHRLVEYVFNIPWSMKIFDGREKSLLREAVRPLLPSSVANRIKTPYPATQDGAYEQGLRNQLTELLNDRSAPIHHLLNHKKTTDLINREAVEISQPYNRGSLEMILWMNLWLQEYNIELAL